MGWNKASIGRVHLYLPDLALATSGARLGVCTSGRHHEMSWLVDGEIIDGRRQRTQVAAHIDGIAAMGLAPANIRRKDECSKDGVGVLMGDDGMARQTRLCPA